VSRRKRGRQGGGGKIGKSIEDVLYPTLDLHGSSGDEAKQLAERWLRARQADGDTTVRLITGRGMHSIGPPVLPPTITELLESLKGTLVRAFEREPGGGAFRVQLRRATAPAVTPSRAEPAVDPALVRRALEALDELGITPTPALIQAEVRRIVKEGVE
jgi:hypothetical protein